MSYFDISGATFDENLRKLETSDPAHADVFNALLGQLINNDVALKEAVTKFAASKNEQALFLLNLHKDGKKYGVHFDNYDVTPSSNGTRLFDAVGMTAAPSTNAVRAVNDFDGKDALHIWKSMDQLMRMEIFKFSTSKTLIMSFLGQNTIHGVCI